jgi:ATP/maltotriose-dependent transcriptional regulator MalT
LVQGARITEESVYTLFAVASALMAGAMLTGIVLVHYIGKGGQAVSLLLLTVFLVLMVVEFALHDKPKSANRELQQTVFRRFLANSCDSLAASHHLTARESEILPYLARGYSHVYIAKEIYVSENTVRTHVKHIYTKLNVDSREALISLIDAQNNADQ